MARSITTKLNIIVIVVMGVTLVMGRKRLSGIRLYDFDSMVSMIWCLGVAFERGKLVMRGVLSTLNIGVWN